MSNVNAISGSTPLNPVLAIPNMPSPQVISGTIGQQGSLPPISTPLNLSSFMNFDTSTLTDLLATFVVNTSQNVGDELFSVVLPVLRGPLDAFRDSTLITSTIMNWANFSLNSHTYYNPIEHLGFVLVSQEPIRGKILVVWNPTDVTGNGDAAPQYSSQRRMITEEWDLAEEKRFFRTFTPIGLVNQMPTDDQPQPRTESGFSEFVAPAFNIPAQFNRFGRLSLFIEQEIQVGSIFPREYTVLVFACFAGTKFSVPIDFRRSNYSNGRESLIVAHRNYFNIRVNGSKIVPSVSSKSRSKKNKKEVTKPTVPSKPFLNKNNV